MSSHVEQVVISQILQDKDIVSYLSAGIRADFFQQERWSRSWSWIYEYWSNHQKIPSVDAYKRNFPSYDLEDDVEDPASGLVEELIERRREFLTKTGLEEAVIALDGGDTSETIHAVARMMAAIGTDISPAKVVRSSDFIGDAVVEAINRKAMQLLGIPTGFPSIDEALGGLQKEQLITIIANPKVGKSTIALAIAIFAQRAGYQVLFLTFEMSNEEVMQRYMSLAGNISLTRLLRGQMLDTEKKQLRLLEEEVMELPDFTLVHDVTSTTTVGGIAAKIELHRPDLIIVDGMYLMDDELGEDRGSSQALTNITRSTKRLAQRYRIPILATTQALYSKTSKTKGVQMGSIGYTSSFAQDSDAIIGIDRDKLEEPEAKLKILGARNALAGEIDISMDYSTGIVEETSGYATLREDKVGFADDK